VHKMELEVYKRREYRNEAWSDDDSHTSDRFLAGRRAGNLLCGSRLEMISSEGCGEGPGVIRVDDVVPVL